MIERLKGYLKRAIRYYARQREEARHERLGLLQQNQLARDRFGGERGAVFRRAVREQRRIIVGLQAAVEALSARVTALQRYEAARHEDVSNMRQDVRGLQDVSDRTSVKLDDVSARLISAETRVERATDWLSGLSKSDAHPGSLLSEDALVAMRLERMLEDLSVRITALRAVFDGSSALVGDLSERVNRAEMRAHQAAEAAADFAASAPENLDRRIAYLETYTINIASDLRQLETIASPMFSRLNAAPYTSMSPQEFKPSARSANSFDYVGFESLFRGPEALVRERQEVYAPFFAGRQAVLDVGCGRGEFLDFMRDQNVRATGVDLNAAMVAYCAAKGLADVHEADAIAWLERVETGTYDAIFSAQFVEHVPFDALVQFVARSYERLSPGGVFIAETVNPQSIDAFKTFYVDPSHVKPLFPEVMVFLCRSVGFGMVRVFYPNGAGFDETEPSSQNEYAVIATK